ncbi:MAG: GNAT family N-acetyltransferase [Deltaproteobacteria bacterium]|nr:GNAT family N-acetyltransferase [Deltaproteobacteria bacterium]
MNIRLHRFLREDCGRLTAWIRNPAELVLWSACTFTFPLTEEQLERHVMASSRSESRRLMFKAVDEDCGAVAGHIEITRIDVDKKKASIAFVLVDPARRREGIGKRIVALALEKTFDQMNVDTVDLFVFDFNIAAIGCYESLGFHTEQLIKDTVAIDGTFQNLRLMSLRKERWRGGRTVDQVL